MEGSGWVPVTHEGSTQWGEGLHAGMGSRLEKPSSRQGQQSPQRPGSRSPHPSHCLPVSFIVESVPRYPLPREPVRYQGRRLCLTPTDSTATALTQSLRHWKNT